MVFKKDDYGVDLHRVFFNEFNIKFSQVSSGIGFRILICVMLLGSMGLASSVLCGIRRVIG